MLFQVYKCSKPLVPGLGIFQNDKTGISVPVVHVRSDLLKVQQLHYVV